MMKETAQLFEATEKKVVEGETFKGIPASPGVTKGSVTVITSYKDLSKVRTGTILVCPCMSPALTIVFPNIRGIVSDHGGMLASAAIVAREYGIPAVVGTSTATASIYDGDIVRVDGTQGRVEVISKAQ